MINPIFRYPVCPVSFYGNKTYVIGHKNPDSDSICSAIGQAHLENQIKTDRNKEYQPISAGDINAETAFALAYFNVQKPKVKEDVSLTIKDAMTKRPIEDVSINKDASIREFIDLIMDKNIKTAVVLNDDKEIEGIVSRKSLAEFMIKPADQLETLKKMDIPFERISKLIDAQVLTGSLSLQDTIKGDVVLGSYSPDTMKKLDLKDSIVIVGDRNHIQEIAIKKGAKALIVTKDAHISSSVIEKAKEKNVIIMSTKCDALKVTSTLQQAVPVSQIMTKNVLTFDANKSVNDMAKIVKEQNYSHYPVKEDGEFVGLISKNQILSPNTNGIILVDHNNPSQFAKGVKKEDIEGIVDHHVQQIMLDSNRVPITYMPVGATATLVARNYKVNGVSIPKNIAGILWCAIISDTDKFTSVTTTPEDKKIANELAQIAGIKETEVLANKLLAQRDANMEKLSADEIIEKDFKTFKTSTGKAFNISQIKTYQSEKYLKKLDEFEEALNEADRHTKAVGSMLMITDSSQGVSYLVCSQKMKNKMTKLFDVANESVLDKKLYKTDATYGEIYKKVSDDVVPRISNLQSRKEQVQPFVSDSIRVLEAYENDG